MRKLWLCLLFALLTGCGAPAEETALTGTVFTSAEEVWAVDRMETCSGIFGTGGWSHRDLESLTEAADEVVLGSAVSAERNALRPADGIVTEFQIQEVWKGTLRDGSVITVQEEGILLPMEQDGTYLLFLQGEYPGPYRLCSPSQGRFVERNGYLFQQTWKSLKIPEAPARTGTLENAVYRLQPHPYDDGLGPPWIMEFTDMTALKAFAAAAETPETCAQWIEENGPVHYGMLSAAEKSSVEEASAIAAVLETLPFPTVAAELGLAVDVYPGYGRDYVEIVHRNGEKICRITVWMEADTVEAGPYGRPVETENFQALFDQTDVLLQENTNRSYVGQVNGHRLSFSMRGFEQEDAIRFLRELEFEALSAEKDNGAV